MTCFYKFKRIIGKPSFPDEQTLSGGDSVVCCCSIVVRVTCTWFVVCFLVSFLV